MAFIDLKDVSRLYGSKRALDSVTLRLEPGRIGLLGPNGAGKSTLLKILLGLLPASAGRGEVLGQELEVMPHGLDWLNPLRGLRALGRALFGAGSALRRSIGYMSEADALVPGMTGAQYVALAGELYGMPRRQAMRRAHEVLTYLDLEDARYRKLEEYSTGMKQRLKLAQALVHDPPVLLLDEPTSGMDPAGRDRMLDLLLCLGRDHGKVIVLSTHLLGDVERVCETAVILYRGKVLLHGPVEQIRARRHDRYRLQIEGPPQAFLEELRLEGVHVLHDNGRGELRVAVPPGWVTRAFFSLADNHGVLLRGLQPDDETLAELFHRVIEQAHGQTNDER
ncbi:MAG: ABC transporter ATP-binding protein [Gemmataceae bacterium]|nr:ABC transporter ATP-binding protein [Gemmataceae bacterium]